MIQNSPSGRPIRPGTPPPADEDRGIEALASTAYNDGTITEVIRPAAIVPENAARAILAELAMRDVRQHGHWDRSRLLAPIRPSFPWPSGGPGRAQLLGTIQPIYCTPTRYEITIYRASVTRHGTASGC